MGLIEVGLACELVEGLDARDFLRADRAWAGGEQQGGDEEQLAHGCLGVKCVRRYGQEDGVVPLLSVGDSQLRLPR